MKQLTQLAENNELSAIDAEFGSLLARKAAKVLGDLSEVQIVGMTGALLSAERGRGHSCLDLAGIAGTSQWTTALVPAFPPMPELRSILTRSMLCNDGMSPAPLVLDGDRVYLYRFHAAELRLGRAVNARVAQPATEHEPAPAVKALFAKLFPADPQGETDWQAVAAATALRNRLTVITGGPGTGKTTTVARILALHIATQPDIRIAVAAPTGKAAARLADAIQQASGSMPVDAAIRERLPREGRTLHRLLGYQPHRDRFTYGSAEPLSEDLIVVDEASMVDLLMMDALFAALRPTARVILIGDPDQLVSVETGHVLGDLCQAADADGSARGMREAVVRLRRSYRFEKQPGIGALATAVGGGDADEALSVLRLKNQKDICRHDPVRDIARLLAPIVGKIEAYLATSDALDALQKLEAFRLLTPLREGNGGVTGLNASIERWLQGQGVHTRTPWYRHRPILIGANDPASGLFNGDLGVSMTIDGRSVVCFPDGAGGVRRFTPARLPAHETAWAMTVHKSQGSEFEHVLIAMPDADSPALTRDLLYTAITRARTRVDIVASEAVLRAAIGRTTARASGLAERLTT